MKVEEGNLMNKWSRLKTPFISLKKKQEGQSMVEFALTFPILLLVIIGIFQFGAILNGHVTVTNAAREGARVAIVGADDAEIEARVIQASTSLFMTPITTENIDISPTERTVGQDVTVSVEGTVPTVIPGFNIFLGSGYTVTGESVMRVEWLD